MAVLADTGFLFALLDRDDAHHDVSKRFFETARGPIVVPAVVLPEVCYLAQKYLGTAVELRFIESLLAGEFPMDWGRPEDLKRAAEILRSRPEFGMVDAAVMATAERLRIQQIATLDRRHFGHFKPAHCPAFELVPHAY